MSARGNVPSTGPPGCGRLPNTVLHPRHRRRGRHRREDRLHQGRRGIPRRRVERFERPLYPPRLPSLAQLREPRPLPRRQRGVVGRRHRWHLLLHQILVHSHHYPLPRLDRTLLLVGAAGDGVLEKPALDRPRRPTLRLDLVHQPPRSALHLGRQRLHIPTPAHRIHHVGHPGLVRQHLLRPQRQRGARRRRQRQRLIVGVRVQRLGPAQHRRQRLHRHTHVIARDRNGIEAHLLVSDEAKYIGDEAQ